MSAQKPDSPSHKRAESKDQVAQATNQQDPQRIQQLFIAQQEQLLAERALQLMQQLINFWMKHMSCEIFVSGEHTAQLWRDDYGLIFERAEQSAFVTISLMKKGEPADSKTSFIFSLEEQQQFTECAEVIDGLLGDYFA